jgi:hypothetical protein
VRRYLLSDPRVIENQGLAWKAVLNGAILRIRPRRKERDKNFAATPASTTARPACW